MDSDLYRAAISGDINFLRENKTKVGDQLVAQNESSVLHLASLYGKTECVQEILKMHPSLLCKVNSAGETALHLAAKCGHCNVVRELINESKKSYFPPFPPPYYQSQDLEHGPGFGLSLKEMMLRVPNVEKDTALHEAARYNRLDVVRLLVGEDPDDSHTPNKADESPLYLAAYRGFDCIVKVICETCTSPVYRGSDGRTVLHASIISRNRNSGSLTYLLGKKRVLIKEVDKHGWTALHYAAYFGYEDDAKSLLQVDKSVAYLPDYTKNRTALHIAAGQGHIQTMKEIIEFCPDCCTMVDKRAQNILHIAIEHRKKEMIRYILQICPVSLLSQKDVDGNTPLHLLAAFGCFMREIIQHEMADKEALNNKDLTPLDTIFCADEVVADQFLVELALYAGNANRTWNLWRVIRGEKEFSILEKFREKFGMNKDDEKERLAKLKKVGETHMIVTALIATISFTAGFTLPGGFDGNPGANQGMAILSNKAGFQAFIIADQIALLFSTTSLVMYFAAATFTRLGDIIRFHNLSVYFNVVAIVAMMVAFITGTYVVLPHCSAIAITLCVIGCSFFLNILFIFTKWYYVEDRL